MAAGRPAACRSRRKAATAFTRRGPAAGRAPGPSLVAIGRPTGSTTMVARSLGRSGVVSVSMRDVCQLHRMAADLGLFSLSFSQQVSGPLLDVALAA